jgi:hypothetical protein
LRQWDLPANFAAGCAAKILRSADFQIGRIADFQSARREKAKVQRAGGRFADGKSALQQEAILRYHLKKFVAHPWRPAPQNQPQN